MSAERSDRMEFTRAREIVLGSCEPVDSEQVQLLDALWRTLAEEIVSHDDVPAADNSAMDGFAVMCADTAEASDENPVPLQIVGEVAAGSSPGVTVGPCEAVRIMTGGVMPGGADAVVVLEQVQERDGDVLVFSAARPGQNIRRIGEDIKKEEIVYKRGEFVGPAELGVLASLGYAQVSVSRRPVAAILTTGNELIEVSEELSPGRVRSSNTYTLFGQIREAGGEARILGNAADAEVDLERMMMEGVEADLLITSGGISAGKYDLVPKVVAGIGEVLFHGVAMKPGNPMSFGRIGGTLWFGLPGNPVASMVCFEEFVRPAILKMIGRRSVHRPEVKIRCGTDIKQSPGRAHFMRAVVQMENGEPFAYPAREQGSGILTSVSLADGLLVVEPGEGVIPRGTELTMRVIREDRYLRRVGRSKDLGN